MDPLAEQNEKLQREVEMLRTQLLWLAKGNRGRHCPMCHGDGHVSEFMAMAFDIAKWSKGFPAEPATWEEWISFSELWQKTQGIGYQGDQNGPNPTH